MANELHPYEPLTSENAALVLIDHQVGLMTGVRDYSTGELKHNVVALAKAAKALKLPIVVTTTARDSMWGPRALVIEPKSCGVLDTPLSRSMTTSYEAGRFGIFSSLRGAKRRSNPSFLRGDMDCFAPLAMTALFRCNP